MKATILLYSQLREKINNKVYDIRLSNNKKSILIYYPKRKPLWYRIGLVLSDGSLLKRNTVIFSVSTSHTTNAIIHAFGKTRLYIARLMKSHSTEKIICCFNILVNDKETYEYVNLLKKGEIPSFLLSDKEKKAQFLAGIIEGDGSIDKDNIRISITPQDPIYRILGIILTNHMRYDDKKMLLRLSTKKLRETYLIEKILPLLEESHKKENLQKIINKRPRFELEDS